jgi:RimJ/RimL family protein N-acetyltransferase
VNPFVLTTEGFVGVQDRTDREASHMTGTRTTAERRTARDGRAWTLRPARPTDAGPLARLFAAVRGEGRWLVTPPSAISEPSEAFFLGEMIAGETTLALVAEADAELVGNVLVSVERSSISDHMGTLSICIADGWRDVGIGGDLVRAALAWAGDRGLVKVALGVFPDNERAIAVYERAGFVREGLRRRQYRSGSGYRDEVLMAWFPPEADR